MERHEKPGEFYVRFFPQGRARIVVSSAASNGERHPIRWGNVQASRTATVGTVIKPLFTSEELVEMQREGDLERKRITETGDKPVIKFNDECIPYMKRNLMEISLPPFMRIHHILSLALAGILFSVCHHVYSYSKVDDRVPVSLVGVHHLGADYFIYKFYIDKSIGDNVGEGGGGGSMVCCLTLPRKWSPDLKVDVRWEVDHVIRASNPSVSETAEVEGIYRAQVPIEKYTELGDLFVHFFPNGRVRIVVSPITADGEAHPIRRKDTNAIRTATAGETAKTLFTAEEIIELKRKADSARKEHGGWR